jgi:hypothetical protein
VSELGARLVRMTVSLRAGTALVTVFSREFSEINAVTDRLDAAFPYSGPMRDQLTEEGICRTLLLRDSAPSDGEPDQSLPPAVALDVRDLEVRQARVRVAATSADDIGVVVDVVLAGLELVGEAGSVDGDVVFTVAIGDRPPGLAHHSR